MKTIFYDDDTIHSFAPRSIFLAGPTGRDVVRTPWRAQALGLLSKLRPEGVAIVPEFRDKLFDRDHFEQPHVLGRQRLCDLKPIPGMRKSSQVILNWETAGIDNCDVLLVWMPFSDELPGRTTRCEVSRAIEQARHLRGPKHFAKLVLGIPPDADTTGHIRYHAYHAGVEIFPTLDRCCLEAAKLTRYYGDVEIDL